MSKATEEAARALASELSKELIKKGGNLQLNLFPTNWQSIGFQFASGVFLFCVITLFIGIGAELALRYLEWI